MKWMENLLILSNFQSAVNVSHMIHLVSGENLEELLGNAPRSHPRLFLPAGEEEALKAKIEGDAFLRQVYTVMLENADQMLNEPLLERKQIGRRLLDVSRLALLRMLNWGIAYRLTGEVRYAERAEADLLAVAAFSDWNPGHFLDVAEMTAAVGIGYDWFYDSLGAESRAIIRTAIIEKGIEPSYEGKPWWVDVHHNWNQVCHAGMVIGSLAIYEDAPDLAAQTIQRALDNIGFSMAAYAPDGNYPEGPTYWGYGTSFNLLLIESLRTVLGSDFGLSQADGFLETADYFLQVAGPSGLFYNYSDAALEPKPSASVFWFAARAKNPGLLWREMTLLRDSFESGENPFSKDRILPMLLIWSAPMGDVTAPNQLSWKGEGRTPVAFHRSSWTDSEAIFLGIKGGTPSQNHAHMDIGGFIMEANGVRWACDLERQDYHELESKGIRPFNKIQRWTVFRANNYSHNVLTVDGQLQNYDGFAPITHHESSGAMPHTIVDLSEVYAGQLAHATRGAGLHSDGYVVIRDELQALDQATSVRWGMVTYADVTIDNERQATLRQDGQQLNLLIDSPEGAVLELYEIEKPPNDYDAPNPGAKMIGFTAKLAANVAADFTVTLLPGEVVKRMPTVAALKDWSL